MGSYIRAMLVTISLLLPSLSAHAAFLIYFTTVDQQGYQVHALDTDSGTIKQLGSVGLNTEVVFDHAGAVFAVFYSKAYMAPRQLQVFEAATLKLIKQLELRNIMLYQWPPQRSNGQFDSTGKKIAIVGIDPEAKKLEEALHFDVVDVDTGVQEARISFPEQMIRKPVLKWLVDGKRLLIISNDTSVARTYDLPSPHPTAQVRLPDFTPSTQVDPRAPSPEVLFIDVSQGVLGLTRGGEFSLYKVTERGIDPNSVTKNKLWDGERPIGPIVQSYDRRWLAVPLVELGRTNTERYDKYFLINTEKLTTVRRVTSEIRFSRAVLSGDGEQIAVSNEGSDIYLLKAGTGKLIKKYSVEGTDIVIVGFIGRNGEGDASGYTSGVSGGTRWVLLSAGGLSIVGLTVIVLVVVQRRRTKNRSTRS